MTRDGRPGLLDGLRRVDDPGAGALDGGILLPGGAVLGEATDAASPRRADALFAAERQPGSP